MAWGDDGSLKFQVLGHLIPDSKMGDEAAARRLVDRWLGDESLSGVSMSVGSEGRRSVGVDLTPMVYPPGVDHDGRAGLLSLTVEGVDVLRPSPKVAEFARG